MTNTILRLPNVKAKTGLSRSTIYLAVSNGRFPQPVKIGVRAVGWLEVEIDAWLNQQVKLSRDSPDMIPSGI